MKNYNKFVFDFMESWKNLEGAKTCELFADTLEYFENPIDPPVTTKQGTLPLWEVVPQNQKDISYTYDILSKDKNQCVVHFTMTRTMVKTNTVQNIDGVFIIKLDKHNKLTYFKQWRFTK